MEVPFHDIVAFSGLFEQATNLRFVRFQPNASISIVVRAVVVPCEEDTFHMLALCTNFHGESEVPPTSADVCELSIKLHQQLVLLFAVVQENICTRKICTILPGVIMIER